MMMARLQLDGRFLLVLVLVGVAWFHPSGQQVSAQATNTTSATNSTAANSTLLQNVQQTNNQSQTALNSSASTNTTTSGNTNATALSANSTSSNSSSILNKDEAIPLDTKITVPFSILGVLLMVSGAPMGFWGGRNRWSSYFLTGAFTGALIIMIPIIRFGVIDQDHHPSTVIQGVFVLACLIAAIAAGALAVIFWKGTRFLVGAGGGFVLSLFILSLKTNSLIPAAGLRWVVILICSTAGFVLATVPKLTIHVTLFATAAMGAAAVVLGIDCFTTGGLKEFWLYIIGFGAMFPRLTRFPFTVTMQAELGVMGGLFIMGAAVQWRLLEVIRKKIDELKQLDQDRRMQEDAAAYRQSMALDADLQMWEKRHGDDGDSATMTLAASPPKHSRKSSQFSLLPRFPGSPMSPQTPQGTFENNNHHTPRPSHDPFLPIDVGGGLATSLGITEELSSPNPHHEHSPMLKHPTDPSETLLPLHNTSHKASGEDRAERAVSIEFERFDSDRRVARPPGAPASWTTGALTSPKPMLPLLSSMAGPLSKPYSSAQTSEQDDEFRSPLHSRYSTATEHPAARPMSEHVSPVLPRPSQDASRPRPAAVASTARPASRVIVGSYSSQAPPRAPVPAQNRESRVMTVEELELRHKSAIKKLQHPTTEKITAATAAAKPSPSNHDHRKSAHLSIVTHGRAGKQDEGDQQQPHSSSSHFRQTTATTNMPKAHSPSSGKPHTPSSSTPKTAPWLSY